MNGETELIQRLNTIEEMIKKGNYETEQSLCILIGGLICGAIASGIWVSLRAAAIGVFVGAWFGLFYSFKQK